VDIEGVDIPAPPEEVPEALPADTTFAHLLSGGPGGTPFNGGVGEEM
jgi:hypothetical protein